MFLKVPNGYFLRVSLVAHMAKNLPTIQETRVWSLGWEDPLEKRMAAHSSILAWRIPQTEEPGGLQSMRSQSRAWLSDWHTKAICNISCSLQKRMHQSIIQILLVFAHLSTDLPSSTSWDFVWIITGLYSLTLSL